MMRFLLVSRGMQFLSFTQLGNVWQETKKSRKAAFYDYGEDMYKETNPKMLKTTNKKTTSRSKEGFWLKY